MPKFAFAMNGAFQPSRHFLHNHYPHRAHSRLGQSRTRSMHRYFTADWVPPNLAAAKRD
jgi:hypothetical protein